MFLKTLILTCVSLLIAGSQAEEIKCEHQHKGGPTKFPPNFKFGVATAAYQIEGAWAEDGKTPSVWDTHTHDFPHMIDDESNGDVAADSYHRFDQDLEALKELGVNFYRFSISWPRILPWGDVTKLNPKGIEYYNMVINKLIEAGITPMVTMFHYDMPDNLAKLGGFTNPVFIEYFLNYADVLFKFFGDRVKIWGTFNEPFDYCYPGYGMGYYPPMVYAPGVGDYMCGEITIKAHARAYRLYKAKYFKSQQGKVGITLSSLFYLSRTNNQDDVDRAAQFSLGWLANPIYGKDGNYPNVMLESVIRNSFQEGQTWSRLRPISEEWKKIIKGSADFIGLNYYTSRYVKPLTAPEGPIPSWNHDLYMNMEQDPAWKVAKSVWLSCVPQGFEDILNWITKQYDGVEIIITENGWSTGDVFEDDDRIEYLRAHLHAVLNAINNGANITAYTYWSLMDNFEWQRGYTEKFGLYYVNRTSPNFERIPRKSVPYYREVIETHRIP